MTPPPKVIQWVDENFPKPHVDPEWLEGCCGWLIGDQHIDPVTSFPEFIDGVKDQLLQSDLHDSMMHGTGLDVHIDRFTGNLRGPPVLVQITAISEIGVSAFQLEQVRVAREERLMSGVGDEEGEEDGDIDVEGEGPMPKYPRATLRFKLSDGATTLEAMEYRTLPQTSLGPTPLGYKLQLKGTRIQDGMAFLEPATVIFLGGSQAELEARRREEFRQGLRERLGLSHETEPEPEAPVVAARSPLRDISPPPSPPLFPQHDDDMDMGARRRRVPASSSTALNTSSSRNASDNAQERPIVGLPRGRKSKTSTTSNDNKHILESTKLEDLEIGKERRPSAAKRNTLTHTAGSQNNTTSSYFNKTNKRDLDDVIMDDENIGFSLSPTTRQLAHVYRPSPSTSLDIPLRVQTQRQNDRSFDFDLLDEIDQNENQPPLSGQRQFSSAAAANLPLPPPRSRDPKGKGRSEHFSPLPVDQSRKRSLSLSKIDDVSSDDYGMMGIDDNDFADAEFLEKLDKVEMEALLSGGDATELRIATTGSAGLSSSAVSGFGSMRSSGSGLGSGSPYVLVDGDRQKSSSASTSASAAIVSSSSSSTKPINHLDIIEIGSSDEDDVMVDTDDKENEPVATRHVRRRTEDLAEGERERGRGLFASQGWNPLGSDGGGRKSGGLGSQSQSQNRSQGLKPRLLATSPKDVIDLSDSDSD